MFPCSPVFVFCTLNFDLAPRLGRAINPHMPTLPTVRLTFLTLALVCASRAASFIDTAATADLAATNSAWLAEHYTKFEYRIPMRDGIRLYTRVYTPKDDSQAWPIILTRTPYALKPYGTGNFNDPAG